MNHAILYKISYKHGNTIFFGCTKDKIEKIHEIFSKDFQLELLDHIPYINLADLIIQLYSYEMDQSNNHIYSELFFKPGIDDTKHRVLCTYCHISLKLKDVPFHLRTDQHNLKAIMQRELIQKIKDIMP
jgi:hypothetical protein